MQIEVKKNFEIKNLTTFKIGGAVENVYFPKSQEEFTYLLKELPDYLVLGNCSNLIISSSGYNGNIIVTTNMKNYNINGNIVTAECGVKGPLLAQKTAEAGLSGFEFMIGFPGTIGGEIFMNASAHGQAVSDKLIRCCLFNRKQKEIIFKEKSEMNFGYRCSCLNQRNELLLSAEFVLNKGNRNNIQEMIDRNLKSRKEIQPNLANPNAGSVFKNPPNDSAGRLLEKAGCKNLFGNNVKVWNNHANFIVNLGNATSEDVLELMLKMYTAVKEMFTIELVPEIIFIGNKTEREEEICNIIYKKNRE